ncbi:hemolysin family protein [Jatrophihabitans sp. DSM 45814]
MSEVWIDLGVVLVLLIFGGLFTATELALVSLRDGQLKAIAERGRRGARVQKLAAEPTRYLAAVQIGSIVAGFFSAAFGTATLADPLARLLERWGVAKYPADGLAVVIITLTITYVALVVSELTPRRYAMQRAEPVALLLGPMLDRLATAFRPLIWFLSKSTNVVLRLLRANPAASADQITSEELRALVASHEGLSEEERRIVRDVFGAGDRQLSEAMLPRTEVDFLEATLSVAEAARLAWEHAHTRYPVINASPDDVIGFVHVRDLRDPAYVGKEISVGEIVRTIPAFPESKPILATLTELQRTADQLALVIDEYGGVAGIVTVEDLVEELVGDIRDEYDAAAARPTPSDRGLGEVDGLLSLSEFRDRTGISLPSGPYETVGGMIFQVLGRLPIAGDAIDVAGCRLTVVAMKGWRIQSVLVTSIEPG